MLKSIVLNRKKPLMIKVSEADKKQIQELADRYTGGNLSAWLREAALKYTPKKSDLIKND